MLPAHLCPVKQKEDMVRTRDGRQIGLTLYLPEADDAADKVLVVGPGAGVEQPFYRPFAEYGARRGYPVVTFDYRSTGRSGTGTLRNVQATLRQWANQDLDAVLRYVRHGFSQKEIVFVGHCISGEIAGIAPASEHIGRMVLVSCALGCWRLWPVSSQPRILLMKLLAPLLGAWFGYFPGTRLRFLRDLPTGVVREFSNWCNRPNGLFDVFPDNNYRKLRIPLLAFSFSDDWLSPPRAVAALLGHFSNTQTRWLHLNPTEAGLTEIGHDGFFDPKAQQLWDTMLEWMQVPKTAQGYFY